MLVMSGLLLTVLTVLYGFLGLGSGCCTMCHPVLSIIAKTMVDNVVIVGIPLRSWVLLLLLLMGKGFMESATCVAKRAT